VLFFCFHDWKTFRIVAGHCQPNSSLGLDYASGLVIVVENILSFIRKIGMGQVCSGTG
jgi:hypothetical protein